MMELTQNDLRMIELAKKIALKSKQKYKHGTVIAKGCKVIDVGCNQDKTHTKAKPYYAHRKLHSEQHAILGNTIKELRGTTLFTVRVDDYGNLRIGRPCHVCLPLIEAAGIKQIIYSNNNGEMETITL